MFESRERFDAIYQLFSRKYPLNQTKIQLGQKEITLFYIKDVDKLLDDLIDLGPEAEAVKDERLPYWAELWPASIALSEFIIENDNLVSGKNALELGCGVGLAGLTAAMYGAFVTISDYQPDALRISELNWLLNLDRSPTSILMDWRNPILDEKFDIIIASDVVYEKRYFEVLINVFNHTLKPDGHIILSEPNRTIAMDFFKMLTEEGYCFKSYPAKIDMNDHTYHIKVYVIESYKSG
ncbi:MAG: methyltransferase domain-containing protein [bacterium]|nr:MAG: methyltransferase domain-containing protein [bacterium]